MRSTCKRGFLFILFALLSASSALGQNQNRITGFVFDEARRPLPDIYVELLTDVYSTVGRTRTGGSGLFSFAGLPEGQYQVKVIISGTGYEEQIKPVSLIKSINLAPNLPRPGGLQEQVDFYLRARKAKPGEVAGPPGVVFAQEVPAAARALYDEGVEALARSDEGGLEKIKRSIEAFPEYFLALNRLGSEYLNRGYYEAAHVLFAKALKVNNRCFACTLSLGLAEFRMGHKKIALDRFREAVQMDRTSINAHLWLGIALHDKQELNASLTSLTEANKLADGKAPEVHWQLARVYKDQQKFAQAAESLENFLKYRPDAQNAEQIRKVIASLRQKSSTG